MLWRQCSERWDILALLVDPLADILTNMKLGAAFFAEYALQYFVEETDYDRVLVMEHDIVWSM